MRTDKCFPEWLLVFILVFICLFSNYSLADRAIPTGSVIFIHPDGVGAATWGAMRIFFYGPDSLSNWDRLERMGLYRSHVLDATNSSSHCGGTIHGFGVKANFDTFGNTPEKPVRSLSEKDYSILVEAQKAGMATVLINSGHICEPGSAAFVANSAKRSDTDNISAQVVNSGVDVILSGGEILLLPEGVIGFHGQPGVRKDGRNLIDEAMANGYQVVYTRDQLAALPDDVDKVFGVFASYHTFYDLPEEELAAKNLPLFNPQAPTVAEMETAALRILNNKHKQFIMVIEQEGTDNFANCNNAIGTLTALKQADDAIGIAVEYSKSHPDLLIITASDSEAGGMQVCSVKNPDKHLPPTSNNGAPIDGISGTNSTPFIAAPDRNGVRLPFGITWAGADDYAGGVIARAQGLNSNMLQNNVDNTDIYRIMYATLFGKILPPYTGK